MNKILKRLLTGVLTLATVFTALPTTAVHAAETQYWTESEERVGIVEKVMNDGSIGSTFNEGHMTVEGEDAYCIDINTGFKNGYKTRSDASTRMTADQIEAQYDAAQHIPLSQAKAGDLVFFHSTYNAGTYVTHVGIYAGNNRMGISVYKKSS